MLDPTDNRDSIARLSMGWESPASRRSLVLVVTQRRKPEMGSEGLVVRRAVLKGPLSGLCFRGDVLDLTTAVVWPA